MQENISRELTVENIFNTLKFLPFFESINKDFYTLDMRYMLDPYVYCNEVNEFMGTLYKENIVFSFDWPGWQKEGVKYFNDPELLKSADILTLRKLLTLHLRKERFCSGHFAEMISSGHILNILKRLYELSNL